MTSDQVPEGSLLVAVHGATGAQGRPVVADLTARGHRVRALARTPARSAARLPAGAESASVDLRDPATLARAYHGVDAAVIVLPGGAPDADAVLQAESILEALRRAGVPRAVFNAGGAVWADPPPVAFLQARTRLVTGLPNAVATATVVGPVTSYMDNYAERWIVEHLQATGELVQTAPAEAPANPVAMSDIAAVISGLLTEDHPPTRVVVHGPGEHTGTQVAAALSAHLGRSVRWTTTTPQDYLRGVAGGLGEQYAANIGALYGGGPPITPPDPPGPGTRHITAPTDLATWIPTQHWT